MLRRSVNNVFLSEIDFVLRKNRKLKNLSIVEYFYKNFTI